MSGTIIRRSGKWVALATGIASLVAVSGAVALGASASGPTRVTEYPLEVIVAKTEPKRPKAGQPFLAMIGIVNQETGTPVQSGVVACPARIGHHGVRMIQKKFFDSDGIAACMWAIPAKAGGKSMVARVEVYSDEGTVRSRFPRVVRR